MQIKELSGFVLAGGNSRRMGMDKGLLKLNGKEMICYSLETLKKICSSVSIISNNKVYSKFAFPVYPDHLKEKGPLAGICTALSTSKTDLNIVISCDSPFITAELLLFLVEKLANFDAVVPTFKENIYPLTAIYSKSCLNIFNERLLKNELRVKDAINFVNTNQLELTEKLPFFDEKILTNINTINEMKKHEN